MQDTNTKIAQHVQQLLPHWSTLPLQQITVQRMTGITNQTFKVSAGQEGVAPIIYRRFGESSQNPFLLREAEIEVYKAIAAAGQGPQIYYFDEGVRIQEFIESTVLPAKHMLSEGYLEEVAFCLAKFHQIKPDSQLIPKQSLTQRCFGTELERLHSACHSKLGSNIFDAEEKEFIYIFREWVSDSEAQFICQVARRCEELGLVFSHNDTLANNFLLRPDGACTVIDYEYAAFNSPLFDIANYFAESVLDYDVPNPPYFGILPPPKPEDKRRFIQAYVAAKNVSRAEFKVNLAALVETEEVKSQVEQYQKLLPLAEMLTHAMWGWWGIVVCKNPLIDFDYIQFVKHRYESYQALKKVVMQI